MAEVPQAGKSASVRTCSQDCACRHNSAQFCRVTRYINLGVQFVEAKPGLQCPSRVSFGTKFVCTCRKRSKAYLREGK